MSLITAPGLHPSTTPTQYFQEPCEAPALNNGTITVLTNECAAKAAYKHPAIDQPDDDIKKELQRYLVGPEVGKPAHALGGVVHRLALGKGADYEIGPYEEYRSKEAKEWRDGCIEAGVIPLKQKQFDQAEAMANVMRHAIEEAAEGHPYQTELVIAWQEPNGIWCRGMLDCYIPALNKIIDIKTAMSISDDAIDRVFNNYSYARQSTFYRRGLDTINGTPGESRFDFLFIENEAPWLSRTADVSEGFRTGCTGEIERAIATWGECLDKGEFPGYGPRTAVPKPWTVGQWAADGIDVEVE